MLIKDYICDLKSEDNCMTNKTTKAMNEVDIRIESILANIETNSKIIEI